MTWWMYALAAAIILAAAQSFSKTELRKIHALQFATELSLYGFILAGFLLPWVKWDFPLQTYLLVILNGAIWTAAFLLMIKALRHAELSEVAPLSNIQTVMTLLFAILLLREFPSLVNLGGIGLIIFGAYIMEILPGGNFLSPFQAFKRSSSLLKLMGAVTLYGLSAVLIKTILETVPVVSFVFFLYASLFLYYLLLDLVYKRENLTHLKQAIRLQDKILILTAFLLLLARILIFLAFERGSVTLSTAVLQSSVFFTVIIGGVLFHERALGRRMAASVLMVVGVLLVIL